MKNKLLIQVGGLITAFLFAVIIIVGFVIYTGSTSMFLNAKNEMIDRDLLNIKERVQIISPQSSMLEYWRNNPEAVRSDYTDQDMENSYIYEDMDDLPTDAAFSLMTDAQKLSYSKDRYRLMCFTMNNDTENLDYTDIYFMDISDGNIGFLYCVANQDDPYYFDSLGQHKDIDLSLHPALEKIRSGEYRRTEYEVFNDPDGDSMYIGYAPVEINGRVGSVICVEYDWSAFRKTLRENLLLMAVLGIIILVILVAILLVFLRRRIISPITVMQKTVRQYMVTKDSSDIINGMKRITGTNELSVFAKDLSDLACDTDEYISEIQKSHDAVNKLTEEVMDALAQAIDAKDEYTNGHSERVAIYSRMIAMNLGLSEEEQQKIYYMGLLHDIGKIGIPKSILAKNSQLTDEEFELVQSHPILGYEILKKIQSEPDLALGARWHHEFYNGGGYPDGKKGEEIPFLVRIIAVADSYDAMTSNRSYRGFVPQDVARAEIEKNIGTQFDPAAAKCMLDIIDADKHYALHE